MKTLINLTMITFLAIGCGSKNKAATDGNSTSSQTINHTTGITNVTGSTNLAAFKTKVNNGEFLAPSSDNMAFVYQSTSYGFQRELKNKTNITRNSSDLDMNAGSTPAEVRNFLISIMNRAGNNVQMVDYQGTMWRFQVENNTIYTIDLNKPLAANPVKKEVYTTSSNTFLKIFNYSSTSLVEGYQFSYARDLNQQPYFSF